jgi:hypothetical protein
MLEFPKELNDLSRGEKHVSGHILLVSKTCFAAFWRLETTNKTKIVYCDFWSKIRGVLRFSASLLAIIMRGLFIHTDKHINLELNYFPTSLDAHRIFLNSSSSAERNTGATGLAMV